MPEDFHGITPKLIAREGVSVKAGEAIFLSKDDERILFPSPVSGKLIEVIRGARRKILAVKIAADGKQEYQDFGKKDASKMSAEEVKNHLFTSGCVGHLSNNVLLMLLQIQIKPQKQFLFLHMQVRLWLLI